MIHETDQGSQGKGKGMRLNYASLVLITVTAAVLLINYVETMVIPGVPDIQKELGTTENVASWITSAFLIVGAAVAPLFGKLGDIYGKKRMFLIVLGFYIAGVGLASLANSIYTLLIARAIQGVGFAVLPLAIALVTDVFSKGRVAFAQGVISGTVAIGTTLGLVLGAYVVEDFGWHYAFYTAFALSIMLFLLVARLLKKDEPGVRQKMDYAGTVMLMGGITLVLIYITEGPTRGWTSYDNLAFLVPGIILVVLFFIYENRRINPLIQLGLLRIRNVLIANLVGIASGVSMFLAFFAVVYYAQQPVQYGGLGLDIIATGLTLAPATVVMMVVGPFIGRMMPRVGPKPIIITGALIVIVGFGLFIVNRSTTLDLTLDAIVGFAGMIAIVIPMVNMISISLPSDSTTVGLGLNSMLRNLGGAIGPVLATTIMTTYTVSLVTNVGGQPMVVGTLPSSAAFDLIFETGIVIMVLILLMGLAIKNYVFRDEVKMVSKPSRTFQLRDRE